MLDAKLLLIGVPALTIAVAAPALILGGWPFFTLAFCIIMIVGLFAGLPIYALLNATGRANWASAAGCGFLIAAAPALLIALSSTPDSASTDGIATVVHGARTAAGWLEILQFAGSLGGLGALAGLVFWLFVRPGGFGVKTAWMSAALVVGLAIAQPILTFDRSCHNTLRDGRDSIGPEAGFELRVALADWTALQAILRDFASERAWSMRADVRPDPAFPWFQTSICNSAGTNIFVQNYPDTESPGDPARGKMAVYVMQPQGGESWRHPFSLLYWRIEHRWPGAVTFQDASGREIPAPAWTRAVQPQH